MKYSHHFDHLGNQLPPPPVDATDWQHKLIQRACVVVIVVCIAIMVWGR